MTCRCWERDKDEVTILRRCQSRCQCYCHQTAGGRENAIPCPPRKPDYKQQEAKP